MWTILHLFKKHPGQPMTMIEKYKYRHKCKYNVVLSQTGKNETDAVSGNSGEQYAPFTCSILHIMGSFPSCFLNVSCILIIYKCKYNMIQIQHNTNTNTN